MPKPGAAGALLAQVQLIREQIEGLDDPAGPGLLLVLRAIREKLEAVEAREQSEVSRAASGIGAAPRFSRLR